MVHLSYRSIKKTIIFLAKVFSDILTLGLVPPLEDHFWNTTLQGQNDQSRKFRLKTGQPA